MPSLSYLLIVAIRASMLGFIVYYATSTIPKKTIDPKNKMMISIIVVVLYALLDYFGGFFDSARNLVCNAVCSCTPNSGVDARVDALASQASSGLAPIIPAAEPTLTLPDVKVSDVDTELDEAIRSLDTSSEEEDIKASLAAASGIKDDSEEEKDSEETKKEPVPAETEEGFLSYSAW